MKNERFEVPEALLSPKLVGQDSTGLAQAVVDCVLKCPDDLRASICEHVILTGGSAGFAGLTDRLSAEINASLSRSGNRLPPVTVTRPLGVHHAWGGASVFATTPGFRSSSVTRSLYEEYGPHIVRRMCIQ